jgi:hypothetical protein
VGTTIGSYFGKILSSAKNSKKQQAANPQPNDELQNQIYFVPYRG